MPSSGKKNSLSKGNSSVLSSVLRKTGKTGIHQWPGVGWDFVLFRVRRSLLCAEGQRNRGPKEPIARNTHIFAYEPITLLEKKNEFAKTNSKTNLRNRLFSNSLVWNWNFRTISSAIGNSKSTRDFRNELISQVRFHRSVSIRAKPLAYSWPISYTLLMRSKLSSI
jgi:hypothetical protein